MSSPSTPPSLVSLPDFDPTQVCAQDTWPPASWESVPALSMRQSWLPVPDPAFRPARVWLAATRDAFAVLAELEDIDIATEARRHNDPLWDLGDVFEIFVRHTQRPEYYEFHVAPNNVTLDLLYPKRYASRADGVEQYMLAEPHFHARADCRPEQQHWRVAAKIPVANLITQAELVSEPSLWQFSFCRYDCGPDRTPAIASTSPHELAGFHRAEEWPTFLAPPFDLS